ncbi:gamma-glutamyltransferase family protein [Gemmatimonas sp.]|uniref:gamma-glutamyltransferase family protein n=1 Tax=Gemmatimonas sp. TaxID=1962908 RepID=UPI003561B58B
MLQSGGSAVDAAIAANLVLSVVYPDMCGAGGDLFALVWIPGEEAPYCLDAAGTGGQGHDLPSYMLRYPNGPPLYGPASVTIPGAPAGWIELHRRFGKLPLAEVFSEAIHYARYGVACPDRLTASMEHWAPPLTTVQFEGGRAAAGVRMRMRAYAQSLELLVAEGPTGVWTHGLGRAIETVTSGLVTEGDLVGYQPRWVEPLHKQVFGRDWWTVPPPSQGYIALLAADVLERLRSTWDLDDPGLWHHMIESIKVAANDRDLVLGDGSVPAAFSEASERARKIQAQAAPFAGPAETGDTVYLNTVDKSGMGVSLVQSLFHPWGSRVQLSEHGIILQNRGSSFDIRPGNPNLMGVGRRPRSTLSPSVVTSSGHLRALIGTMGGDVQPQVLLQLLVGTQLAGLEPGHALAHPRFYIHRGLAPSIWSGPQPVLGLEDRFHPSIVKDLTQRGHPVRVGAPFVELAGHAQIIQTQGAGTLLSGAADPRSGASGVAAW